LQAWGDRRQLSDRTRAPERPATHIRATEAFKLRALPSENELERMAPIEGTTVAVNPHRSDVRLRKGVHPTVVATVESLMLEERTKWAMHIHDGLTQSVTSAVLELQILRHKILADPDAAAAELEEVEDAMRNDLKEIRQVLFELQEGRRAQERPFAAFVADVVERWKLPARVSIEGDIDEVPAEVLETAHGVVAEALANAAKHSGSKDVAVRVRAADGMLRIEVEDRGRGLAASTDDDPHFGLRLLRARAEQLGGTVDIGSTPGSGVRVVAALPVGGRGETR
jgi:two-component system, NarL family, nitrate/nitrite sensor histidine kinase NarX